MHTGLLGISHNTAPVAVRERIALDGMRARQLLDRLRSTPGVAEALVLSTCNRTEVYAVFDDGEPDPGRLLVSLCDVTGEAAATLEGHVYRLQGADVAHHLFSVAAGLDSMVIGESQILAQVRAAYAASVAARASGAVLDAMLHRAFRVGKAVRSRTGVGCGRVSVGGVACDLADKLFGGLGSRSVLLVGAGETGELVARHLVEDGVGELWITNRTGSRARDLVSELGGRAIPWDRFDRTLGSADVVITAVAAAEPILSAARLARARAGRDEPLLLIDIAVPRNVCEDVSGLHEVYLYDLDALQEVVRGADERRCEEVHAARAIVGDEVAKLGAWLRQQRVNPAIVQLRQQFEAIRQAEMEKLRRDLDPEALAQVDRATRALTNRLLHHPTVGLKHAARRPDSEPLLAAFLRLLGLEDAAAT